MTKLIEINSVNKIPAEYQNTPIGKLLEYHNFGRAFDTFETAELLVGMCMDHRKHLCMPNKFSYIIRTGGANMQYSEFKISYAIAIGKVRHIALIGHNNCGMEQLHTKEEDFVIGLTEGAGWEKHKAKEHFNHFAPKFEIENATDFILSETKRLRKIYPKIKIAPMFYLVEDNKLYCIEED